ncbi:prepilin-type N-terminal cleavage/methylation domain-containing protein [Candidatus Sumerlaeota bacterium]|nr:prepilin-type N-terminal cleavage/methylation domain-containing protein [Candidatus Sumerlaeota bacterium]
MNNKKYSAFTLIELLVVVAIIALLSSIAVPNFLAAQMRAKVSRARADIRSLMTALEAYRTEANKYPICTAELKGLPPLSMLTTPIAYIAGVHFKDPFFGVTNGVPYDYYGYSSRDYDGVAFEGSGRNPLWYILTSNGPDKCLDDYVNPMDADDFTAFIYTIYDPTNGLSSPGNIYRSGGQIAGLGEAAGHFIAAGTR